MPIAKENDSYDNAQHSLKRLRDLQTQKDSYTKSFHDLEAERKATLAKEEEVNSRIQSINAEIDRLQKELEILKPQHKKVTQKLNYCILKHDKIYLSSSSLYQELTALQLQKMGFDDDLKKG